MSNSALSPVEAASGEIPDAKDLKQYELDGRRARIKRFPAEPPDDLDRAARTAWYGGYCRRQGFDRARDGMINPQDDWSTSYSARCRNLGVLDYYRQSELARDILGDDGIGDPHDAPEPGETDENQAEEPEDFDMIARTTETLVDREVFDEDSGHVSCSD